MTIDFEKSNRATKRKSRIQNSTSKYDFENSRNRIRESTSKFDFKIRHENFGSKQDTKTQTRIENFRANEKASRRTTDERREAHSHETRTHSHETAPERTPETTTTTVTPDLPNTGTSNNTAVILAGIIVTISAMFVLVSKKAEQN